MNRRNNDPDGRERWDLWNLQALFPEATPTMLGIIRKRRRRVETIEKQVLDQGQMDLSALLAEAKRFMGEHPELGCGVIATLHLGPYALVPVPLMLAGRDPVVVLDHQAMQRIKPIAEQQAKFLELKGELDWIAVDGDHFVVKILRALRDGRPVVVYLDGNRGAGGMEATRDRGMSYSLPGRTIMLRTGLGRLIRRTGCPVNGMAVRWRGNGTLEWEAGPVGAWDEEASAKQITAQLYDWMFGHIVRTPEQWLSWEMLRESSACFSNEGRRRIDSRRVAHKRAVFRNLLDRRAAEARVTMPGKLEVWEKKLLVDLTDQNFYTADGLRDETLDLLRWGAEPTLEALTEACGRDWIHTHLLRLYLLDLVDMKIPS
jgi:hypothetical protein